MGAGFDKVLISRRCRRLAFILAMMTFLRSRWLQESRAGTDDRRAKRRRESHEPSCNAERDVRKPCILMSGSLSFVYYSLQNAPQPRRGRAGLAHLRESRIPMASEHTQLMVLGLALVRDAPSWFPGSLRLVCLGTSMIICMASSIRAFTTISLSKPQSRDMSEAIMVSVPLPLNFTLRLGGPSSSLAYQRDS